MIRRTKTFDTKIVIDYNGVFGKESEMSERTEKRRLEKGFCRECGDSPFVDGKQQCQKCLDHARESARQRKAERLNNGLCQSCGKSPFVKGKKYCEACIDKQAEINRRRRVKNDLNGLCQWCGKEPSMEGKSSCRKCHNRNTETRHKQRSERKLNGLCFKCGKDKFVKRKTLCQKCLDLHKEISRRIRLEREANGLCASCGINPARNVSKKCEICTLESAARKYLGSKKRVNDLKVLFLKQKQRCPYTGIILIIGTNTSLDHKIPKSKGGKDEIQNLQWVHIWANLAKRDYSEHEFIEFCKLVSGNR